MSDDLESVARPILVKLLNALDNEEKIQASSPVELLNCIMKILRMVKEDKGSSLGDLVRDKLGTIADLAQIKNSEPDQERTDSEKN